MCMTSAHGTTNGSAYAIWWAMLCGTSTQTDRGCTRGPIFMRSLRSQPLSSALRLKNNTREQHECTNLMHSDLGGENRIGRRVSQREECEALGSFLLPCAVTRVSLLAVSCLSGATPRGQRWTSTVTLPQGRNGLRAWRMAVLSTFRELSLCRQVHRELMRSTLLDLTPIISATVCHQRNYVERYSRFNDEASITASATSY